MNVEAGLYLQDMEHNLRKCILGQHIFTLVYKSKHIHTHCNLFKNVSVQIILSGNSYHYWLHSCALIDLCYIPAFTTHSLNPLLFDQIKMALQGTNLQICQGNKNKQNIYFLNVAHNIRDKVRGWDITRLGK